MSVKTLYHTGCGGVWEDSFPSGYICDRCNECWNGKSEGKAHEAESGTFGYDPRAKS